MQIIKANGCAVDCALGASAQDFEMVHAVLCLYIQLVLLLPTSSSPPLLQPPSRIGLQNNQDLLHFCQLMLKCIHWRLQLLQFLLEILMP